MLHVHRTLAGVVPALLALFRVEGDACPRAFALCTVANLAVAPVHRVALRALRRL